METVYVHKDISDKIKNVLSKTNNQLPYPKPPHLQPAQKTVEKADRLPMKIV